MASRLKGKTDVAERPTGHKLMHFWSTFGLHNKTRAGTGIPAVHPPEPFSSVRIKRASIRRASNPKDYQTERIGHETSSNRSSVSHFKDQEKRFIFSSFLGTKGKITSSHERRKALGIFRLFWVRRGGRSHVRRRRVHMERFETWRSAIVPAVA